MKRPRPPTRGAETPGRRQNGGEKGAGPGETLPPLRRRVRPTAGRRSEPRDRAVLQLPSCPRGELFPHPASGRARRRCRRCWGKVAQGTGSLGCPVGTMLAAGVRRFATSALRRSHYEEGPGKVTGGGDRPRPRPAAARPEGRGKREGPPRFGGGILGPQRVDAVARSRVTASLLPALQGGLWGLFIVAAKQILLHMPSVSSPATFHFSGTDDEHYSMRDNSDTVNAF